MGNICCIYSIKSPSGKIYIGQTINFRRRINSYKNYKNCIQNQTRLLKSLNKYGFENHNIEVLLISKREELDFWEEFYIALFNSFNSKFGLNSTSGGKTPKKLDKQKRTQEWNDKISKSHIGKKRLPFSDEWKQNISKSLKGIVRGDTWLLNIKKAAIKRKENGGYIISEEQKEKLKISIKNYYNSQIGIERRNEISVKAKKTFSIPVMQYTMNNEFIKKWDSARQAALGIGIKHPNLVNCTNGKSKSAGGYIWKKENVSSFTANEETFWNDAFNR
jgi:group I intron endonuclease